MTVIIIDDSSIPKGGTAQVAVSSAIGLAKKGIDVVYISADGESGLIDEQSNIRHIDLQQYELGSNPNVVKDAINGLWNREVYKKCQAILSEYNPSDTIIHIHGFVHRLSPSVLKACNDSKIRTVVTTHDQFIVCPNGGLFDYARGTVCAKKPMSRECIFCNCDKRNYLQKVWRVIRQYFIAKYLKNNKNIILFYISESNYARIRKVFTVSHEAYYVRNPYDLGSSENYIAENNRKYVFLGRLSEEKGITIFCEAFTDLIKQCGFLGKAVVVGDGNIREEYEQKYPEIKFYGWKNHDEIEEIIKESKALILPSLCYEGAPLTPIEFMAHGIPCIVSDICTATEYIKDGETGLVFKSGDVNNLKEKVLYAENDNNWKRISQCLRESFNREEYSQETHLERLIEIYGKILQNI